MGFLLKSEAWKSFLRAVGWIHWIPFERKAERSMEGSAAAGETKTINLLPPD